MPTERCTQHGTRNALVTNPRTTLGVSYAVFRCILTLDVLRLPGRVPSSVLVPIVNLGPALVVSRVACSPACILLERHLLVTRYFVLGLVGLVPGLPKTMLDNLLATRVHLLGALRSLVTQGRLIPLRLLTDMVSVLSGEPISATICLG